MSFDFDCPKWEDFSTPSYQVLIPHLQRFSNPDEEVLASPDTIEYFYEEMVDSHHQWFMEPHPLHEGGCDDGRNDGQSANPTASISNFLDDTSSPRTQSSLTNSPHRRIFQLSPSRRRIPSLLPSSSSPFNNSNTSSPSTHQQQQPTTKSLQHRNSPLNPTLQSRGPPVRIIRQINSSSIPNSAAGNSTTASPPNTPISFNRTAKYLRAQSPHSTSSIEGRRLFTDHIISALGDVDIESSSDVPSDVPSFDDVDDGHCPGDGDGDGHSSVDIVNRKRRNIDNTSIMLKELQQQRQEQRLKLTKPTNESDIRKLLEEHNASFDKFKRKKL